MYFFLLPAPSAAEDERSREIRSLGQTIPDVVRIQVQTLGNFCMRDESFAHLSSQSFAVTARIRAMAAVKNPARGGVVVLLMLVTRR